MADEPNLPAPLNWDDTETLHGIREVEIRFYVGNGVAVYRLSGEISAALRIEWDERHQFAQFGVRGAGASWVRRHGEATYDIDAF